MATDAEQLIVETAERSRDRLLRQLARQRKAAAPLWAWYCVEQDLPGDPVDNYTGRPYRRMRESARNSWARLIVDAIGERLEVQGYRSGDGNVERERAVWNVLQANRIDAEQVNVYTEALATRQSYVMVAGDADDPIVTAETALEVTHEWLPGRRGLAAALKAFELDPGLWRVELYTPEYVFAWLHDRDRVSDAEGSLWDAIASEAGPSSIKYDDDEFELGANELGVVNVVPFENRPTTATGPRSELEDLVPIMQRIDELTLEKAVAAHFAAFRQKWATGLEVPRDPETGRPVEAYTSTIRRLWISDDPETKFGSFEATDLKQYDSAIDAEVAELAAVSRVPAHYLLQSNLANPPSAESLVAGESGLVLKCRARQRGYGESWEAVASLVLLTLGDEQGAADRSSSVQWRDPQVRHPAQVADAAVKFSEVGVPREALWSYIGATPQEVERWRVMAAEDELAAAAAAPPAPVE